MYFKIPTREEFTVYGVISTKENDYLEKPIIQQKSVGNVLEKPDIIYGDIDQNFYENGKYIKYIQSNYFEPPLEHLPSTFFSQDIYNPDYNYPVNKIYQQQPQPQHQPLAMNNNNDVIVEKYTESENCKCNDAIVENFNEEKILEPKTKTKTRENFLKLNITPDPNPDYDYDSDSDCSTNYNNLNIILLIILFSICIYFLV